MHVRGSHHSQVEERSASAKGILQQEGEESYSFFPQSVSGPGSWVQEIILPTLVQPSPALQNERKENTK